MLGSIQVHLRPNHANSDLALNVRQHEQILLDTLQTGMLLNGYNTNAALPRAELDCFIGGLVATGIAPQIAGMPAGDTPASWAPIKYWLDLFKTHGMATEDKITALHYPDVFWVELEGGISSEIFQSYGLYDSNSTVMVALPSMVADNATVLTYQGDAASCINMSMVASKNLTAITFFAANNLTLSLSGAPFWATPVMQTVTATNGTQTTTTVSTGGVFLPMKIGEYVRFDGKA